MHDVLCYVFCVFISNALVVVMFLSCLLVCHVSVLCYSLLSESTY